ncbi:zinc ribbon domain-containing protein, partial [Limnoraphis robusta]|uniref:zinc ribbon domain-containing protein n=1 Tax=Limnoraphis robusta TaxID=1118279 RepID=UPI002B204B7E
LSTRTHKCSCGCELQRDHNAALNILKKGLGTVGHIGTKLIEQNASEETTYELTGFNPSVKADSLKEESS